MTQAAILDRPETVIGVLGLGYVGLPLLIELAKTYKVIGFDINASRVNDLRNSLDNNNEIEAKKIENCPAIFTSDEQDLDECNFFIVTVPTPIDDKRRPDLSLVENAAVLVARHLKRGDIVVLESTVYPGVTENIFGRLMEDLSGLACNRDFYVGYSPERINPGDNIHTIDRVTKIISAQNDEVLEYMAEVYGSINQGKIFRAKSIKTAEAAKVVENTQRDINIAFINEITKILNQDNINIHDVLDATKTKWNFLDFKPGLVGGHCISVDPYYLIHYSENMGISPNVISSGRITNDDMATYIADHIQRHLKEHNWKVKKILLLGFSFKENVSDIRNTKVYDFYKTLEKMGYDIHIHDPLVNSDHFSEYPGLPVVPVPSEAKYDMVALCVPHLVFTEKRDLYLSSFLKDEGIVFDIKGVWKEDRKENKFKHHYFSL